MRRIEVLMVVLIGLSVILVDHFSQASDNYPILTYAPPANGECTNPPYNNRFWPSFGQMDSCGLDGFLAAAVWEEDWDSVEAHSFKVIQHLSNWWVIEGQTGIYEADLKWIDGRVPPNFTGYYCYGGTHRVGREVRDLTGGPEQRAINGFAWKADSSLDTAGYVVRRLKQPWANELGLNGREEIDTCLYFYAIFRVKTDDITPCSGFLTFYAVRETPGQNDTLCYDSLVVDRSELAPANIYKDIILSFHTDKRTFRTACGYKSYNIRWNGVGKVWIDRVTVHDSLAYKSIYRRANDETVDTRLANYDSKVYRWSLVGEPWPKEWPISEYWRQYLDSVNAKPAYQDYPAMAKAFPYNFQDTLKEYLSAVQLDQLPLFIYPFNSSIPESSPGVQEAFDSLAYKLDRSRAVCRGSLGRHVELVYIAQTFQEYNDSGQVGIRYPTAAEQEALIWMGMAHGVDGVEYFTYSSWYVTEDFFKANPPVDDDRFHYWIDNTHWIARIRGLSYYDPDSSRYRRVEPSWYAVRRVNRQLSALDSILSDSTAWDKVFTCGKLQRYFSSFESDEYTADSAYVEIATFEHENVDYFLLLNRRCLSTEAQGVRVELNLAGNQYFIIGLDSVGSGNDMYYDFVDSTYSGKLNGKIPFSTYLAPGQGKFFKVIVAQR